MHLPPALQQNAQLEDVGTEEEDDDGKGYDEVNIAVTKIVLDGKCCCECVFDESLLQED
jgi:hypothetical protein